MELEQEIIRLHNEGGSVRDIAKELGLTPSKVQRLKTKLGLERTRSDAQKLNLEKNGHPMTGKETPEETKLKISKGLMEAWQDPELAARQSANSKKKWEERSDLEKKQFSEKGLNAVRETAKAGSLLENLIAEKLREAGYEVIQHYNTLINEHLEVDIFLPSLYLAIEVDGPSHFLPVWGEEKFAQQKKADAEKFGLLKMNGMKLIRVKNVKKKVSLYDKTTVVTRLLALVEDLDNLQSFTELDMQA